MIQLSGRNVLWVFKVTLVGLVLLAACLLFFHLIFFHTAFWINSQIALRSHIVPGLANGSQEQGLETTKSLALNDTEPDVTYAPPGTTNPTATDLFGSATREDSPEVLSSCTIAERRQWLHDMCSKAAGSQGKLFLRRVVIDHTRKILYCRIPKCANTATKKYFHMSEREHPGPINMSSTTVSVEEVNTLYADYRKLIVVRHPLQRLVSAFYEVTEKHDPNKLLGTFDHFVNSLLLKGATNCHWGDYYSACSPCHVDYDLLIKTETMETDTPVLNAAFGLAPTFGFPEHHINANVTVTSSMAKEFKYDSILKTFQAAYPAQFEMVLAMYQVDMKLFGYTWAEQGSQCHIRDRSCC